MKTIFVIGIGKFGHHFAEKLIALGNEVMIIDRDEDKNEGAYVKGNKCQNRRLYR